MINFEMKSIVKTIETIKQSIIGRKRIIRASFSLLNSHYPLLTTHLAFFPLMLSVMRVLSFPARVSTSCFGMDSPAFSTLGSRVYLGPRSQEVKREIVMQDKMKVKVLIWLFLIYQL